MLLAQRSSPRYVNDLNHGKVYPDLRYFSNVKMRFQLSPGVVWFRFILFKRRFSKQSGVSVPQRANPRLSFEHRLQH